MLTKDHICGPWAALPVAWTDDDRSDEETCRADVTRRWYENNFPEMMEL